MIFQIKSMTAHFGFDQSEMFPSGWALVLLTLVPLPVSTCAGL